MADKSVSKRLQNSILAYSALMILVISAIIAGVSIVPLYQSLQKEQQRSLFFALKTRTFAVEEYLSRAKGIALQIASRTTVRNQLEAYNRGEISRQELRNFSQPILRDALAHSQELAGIYRLDAMNQLVVQVGLPIPEEFWPIPVVASEVEISPIPMTLAQESYLVVGVPIVNPQGGRVGTDIVLFQLSRLQEIVEDYTGLGDTGETILGTIHHQQVQLFFPLRGNKAQITKNLSKNSALGLAITKAFEQESGILSLEKSYESQGVIAYSPIIDSNWGIVIRIDPQELYAPVRRQIVLIASIIGILILIGTRGMVLLLRPLTGRMIVHTDELERLLQAKTATLQAELNQRQQAEEAIRFQAHLLDAVEQAVIATDLNGVITYWNQFAQKLYGWSATEAVGRPIGEVTLGQALQAKAAEIISRLGKGESWSGEFLVQRRDGTSFPAMVTDSPIYDREGRLIGIVGISGDISELKEVEAELQKANNELEIRVERRTAQLKQANEQLHSQILKRQQSEQELARRAEELARSNAELEQFAYVASHDLQEPLRMIASYTQLLAKRYQNHIDDKADRFIGYIVDGANRMQTLINDLLEYSRLGTQGKEFQRTNCQMVFDQVIANLQIAIEQTGAVIICCNNLPTVMADKNQLVQLFQNLMGNAIKYRSEQPPKIEVNAERHDGQWLFRFRDNGIGIPAKYTERIFLIFQRLYTQDEYPGNGIGLALCKKIVEGHGGHIWVESELGKGSTFYFTILDEGVTTA